MSDAQTRFFVAGATGYTGQAVVTHALARGVAVTAHVRPGSASGDAAAATLVAAGAAVDRTPWEADAMARSLARVQPTHVFSLLGTTARRGKADGSSYESVDRDLSLLLLAASVQAGSRPCFVYLSALGAAEGSSNRYLAVRGVVESAVRESGLPYVIARPSFITGADRQESRPGERVAASVADVGLKLVGALGGRTLADRWSSLDASTLARGLCACALAGREGQVIVDAAVLRTRAG